MSLLATRRSFFVESVARAAGYYRDALGFDVELYDALPEHYAYATRDACSIHFACFENGQVRPNSQAAPPDMFDVYVNVDDLAALYDELVGRGGRGRPRPSRSGIRHPGVPRPRPSWLHPRVRRSFVAKTAGFDSRLGVDDHVGDLRVLAPDALLDLARVRMRLGEGALGSMPEREEGDETLVGAEEAELARLGPVASRTMARTAAASSSSSPRDRALRGRLGERLEMRLHPSTSGRAARIASSTSSATSWASASGSEPGSFRWSETRPVADVEHGHVVDLAHARDPERRRGARSRSCPGLRRLDVDDHVRSGHRLLDGGLHRVGRRVPLLDRGPGRDADDDVGE